MRTTLRNYGGILMGLLLALVICAGFGALAASGAVQAGTAHRVSCGFLDDMNSGAASLVPNGQLAAGAGFWQESTGAWQMCQEPSGLICMKANQGWCMADKSGAIKLEQASLAGSEVWTQRNQSGGGFRLRSNSPTPRYLCALGGLGTSDIGAATLANCPRGANFDTWFWSSTALAHTTVLVSHRCSAPWDQAVEPSTSGFPGWGEADWEGQNCGFAMKVHAQCANRFTSVTEHSGTVTANEVEDRASCNSTYPTLTKVSINFGESGFWVGWCEIWPTYSNCHTRSAGGGARTMTSGSSSWG